MIPLQRTALGNDEVATRKHALPPLQRSVPLLADGARSDAALHKTLSQLGDVAAAITQLVLDGLVARVVSDSGNVAHSQEHASMPPRARDRDRVRAQSTEPMAAQFRIRAASIRVIRKSLEPALGPRADEFMLRLEQAKDASQYAAACELALKVLAGAKGAGAAALVREQLVLLVEARNSQV
jgi:hypothetical protein